MALTARTAIAAVLLAVIVAIGVIAWKKLYAPKGGKKADAGGEKGKAGRRRGGDGPSEAEEPTSAAIPLRCIEGQYAIRTDGAVVTAVKVESVNTSLYTKAELVRESSRNAAALATIAQPFSIIQVHRSPDNSKQRARHARALAEIDAKLSHLLKTGDKSHEARAAREHLLFRRTLVQSYMADDERSEANPMASETDTFICLRTDKGRKDARESARVATAALMTHLVEHGFDAHVLGEDELIWLMKAYFDEPPAAGANLNPYAQIPLPDYVVEDYAAALDDEEEDYHVA